MSQLCVSSFTKREQPLRGCRIWIIRCASPRHKLCSAFCVPRSVSCQRPFSSLSSIASDGACAGAATAAISTSVVRSEEHTSELQSLMRISYAVFCLKKKKHIHHNQ